MVSKLYDNPEIWRIDVPLPENPLRNLNSYVVRSNGHALVIDTGFNRSECHEALWEGLRELEVDLGRTELFLTHLHSDHCGLVQGFVDRGCQVYMSEVDYEYLRNSREKGSWGYMEQWFGREGFPDEEMKLQASGNQARLYAPKEMFPAAKMKNGDTVHVGDAELLCISTPGHTPGHVVLYMPDGQILFSGDHILFDITPNISVWRNVPHSLADYMESLRKVKKLPIRLTLPAHRKNDGDVYERIDAILEHHRIRLEEIRRAVVEEPGTDAYTVASKITWSMRGKKWKDFPPNQKWFAMGETLAHLYWLVDAGYVKRWEEDGKARYQAAEAFCAIAI